MNTNILVTALALTDGDLLARLPVLAAHERSATAELVAHLAALRLRPSLYAAQGYGSLFAYCRHALRLSEDAVSNRIHAARACLKFPAILDFLASGELSLSAVRMLRPHLTMENHERVLGRARNARRPDIERLVAELAPRPDVPASIRRLALAKTSGPQPPVVEPLSSPELPAVVTGDMTQNKGGLGIDLARPAGVDATPPATPCVPRPVVQPLSPGRYCVQFTIGQDAHDVLRRLQTLLRREIPDGDTGAIFERALGVLHEKVEAAKFGRTPKSKDRETKGQARVMNAYENRIRPGADPRRVTRAMDPPQVKSASAARSRHIPTAVRRAVWYRDRGQCAFVSVSGQRCVEREFLELHHIQPYALKGPATAANITLRCRLHNAYEAEIVFGARARLPLPNDTSSSSAP